MQNKSTTMDLYSWRQQGEIYFWRYKNNPSNYAGWHLSADATGADSLILLLEQCIQIPDSLYRTLTLTKPDAAASVANCRDQVISFPKVKLIYTPDGKEQWTINETEGEPCLNISKQSAQILMQGLQDIKAGRGDYALGDKEHRLWFWWCLK
ncbi:hypothetical protein EUZ85_22605 [Hahella sp. KA22]|uniref:hypothetical protein n=1 Tax=Hahella sp. KA22 TaxID=1628392 RepID=UPI000FDED904|nr:hypothetical protein [Hahella sp. KA22]AZZ93361.1 hypothetical protein ENC22_20025 [Hahella sp. KA22]QAY56736.1 hypothetical protein EUZ85_22605 [Hahella sp. KA22]